MLTVEPRHRKSPSFRSGRMSRRYGRSDRVSLASSFLALFVLPKFIGSIETYAASINRNDCPDTFNSRMPLSRILRAAFKSRSISVVPQDGGRGFTAKLLKAVLYYHCRRQLLINQAVIDQLILYTLSLAQKK